MEDARLLGVKLDNVQFKGKKIYANLPRFERGRKAYGVYGMKRFSGVVCPNRFVHRFTTGGAGTSWFQKNVTKSYAEVVTNNFSVDAKIISDFTTNLEDRSKYSKAMVGEVKIPSSSSNILVAFHSAGIFLIKVSVMGPNLCLLEELEEGAMEEIMREEEMRWKEWFSNVRCWKEEEVDTERLITIRVFGVLCFA